MTIRSSKNCILFDWGDTLMRVFPEYQGAMADWPQVAAVAHAGEVLAKLHTQCRLAVATNAKDSDEAEIWAALQRVNLAEHLDQVYCLRRIGYAKPFAQFFAFILDDLQIPASQVLMVGDELEKDILGANLAGLRAVWLNEHDNQEHNTDWIRTIHDLSELPDALKPWQFIG